MRFLLAYLRVVAFFAFSAVVLPVVIYRALRHPGTEAYWPAATVWIRGILRIFGVHLVVTGSENIAPDRAYVVMANHRSQLDPVAMGVAVLPRITRWVAKKELRAVPLLGWTLEATGQIFVDRGDRSAAVGALTDHTDDRDALICFFPEGHRSSTTRLLPFKKGGAAFAIASGLPVLPMAVSGTERCLPNHSIVSRPGTIRVVIGGPIETAGLGDDDRAALTDRVRDELEALLASVEPRPGPEEVPPRRIVATSTPTSTPTRAGDAAPSSRESPAAAPSDEAASAARENTP